ncbi:cytochrome P450 [Suillus paluster]|uniref:cytochrome P450 n=1 Tax=Suillus paluster TaxID=48578 RepID=UPI001B87B3BC|nr:cytochrome P450 [Suillus paluster]KAG1732267.1 cytochrome P450 [Suillus paluster]
MDAGNIERIFLDSFESTLKVAADYGGVAKVYVFFGEECLFVSDPRALHHMLVKEPHIFEENDTFIEGTAPKAAQNAQSSVLHIQLRELLPVIQNISHQLKSILVSNIPTDTALDSRNESEYTAALRMLGLYISKTALFRPFVPLFMRNFSPYWRRKIADWLTISWLPTQTMRDFRELRRIVEVTDASSRSIFQQKKAALEIPSPTPSRSHDTSGGTRGKDIMSIMIKANASSSEADRLSDAELLGQMKSVVHYDFAGVDTTTAAVARALYMLAKHPHIQEQLRAEIRDAMTACEASDVDHSHAKDEGGSARLSYDALMGLPFLDAVVRETLRLYPSLPVLTRSCLGRGCVGMETRTMARFDSRMTFLAGNRACIGFKFAEMEMMTSALCQRMYWLLLCEDIHFSMPSEPDENGHVKDIYWNMSGFHIPVVKAPAGDGETPQLPLCMRTGPGMILMLCYLLPGLLVSFYLHISYDVDGTYMLFLDCCCE